MNHDERDERLGAALRQLPVPDHAPGFWDDLAGRLAGEAANPVVRLDEQRRARRRRFVPLGAAAAVVAALLGAGLVVRDTGDGRRVVADRPPTVPEAAPAMVTVSYTGQPAHSTCVPPECGPGEFVLTVADDGSFRWSGAGGTDVAYDAATRTLVERAPGGETGGTFTITDLPPGGPDLLVRTVDPIGPLADFVVSLARAGDQRVAAATHAATGRPVWRYDGPVAEDRLSGGNSPDHVLAEADRQTGVLLTVRADVNGRTYQDLAATEVDTAGAVDRSRFRPAEGEAAEVGRASRGFKAASREQAAAAVPYRLLVPGEVPDGFALTAIAVNQEVASPTGPEGMNPAVVDVVAMHWRKGFFSFTVTLRPVSGQTWDDPFAQEGKAFRTVPLAVKLEGRPPLVGDLVVDGGALPHFWGVTSDVVVTADGDLTVEEFHRLAGSLQG